MYGANFADASSSSQHQQTTPEAGVTLTLGITPATEGFLDDGNNRQFEGERVYPPGQNMTVRDGENGPERDHLTWLEVEFIMGLWIPLQSPPIA